MTEERTGNNSPGVWHRHLCVLWAQVDSCLPLLVTRTSWMWAEGEDGRTGDMRLKIQSGEKCFKLWLWSWLISDVGVTWCQAGLASSELTGPGLWRDIFFCFDSSAKISPARTLWPLNSGALLSAPHLIQALLTCHLAPGNVANINYHVECVNVCNLRTSSHHGTWKVFINLIFVCLFHLYKYLANFIANKLWGKLAVLSVMKNAWEEQRQ